MDYLIIEGGKIVGAIGATAMFMWLILRALAHKALQNAAGDEDKDPSKAIDDIAELLR